jgi:hypothetical protein
MERRQKIKESSSQYIAKMAKFLITKRKLVSVLNKHSVPDKQQVNESRNNLKKIVNSRIDLKKKLRTMIQY